MWLEFLSVLSSLLHFVPCRCISRKLLRALARRGKFHKWLCACGAVVHGCRCRSTSDEKKLAFTLDALCAPDPFKSKVSINHDVIGAIEWQASKTDAEIMQFRETFLKGCEDAGKLMWDCGACEKWFAESCDEIIMV